MSGVFEKNNGGVFIYPVIRDNIYRLDNIIGEITTDDMFVKKQCIFYLCKTTRTAKRNNTESNSNANLMRVCCSDICCSP